MARRAAIVLSAALTACVATPGRAQSASTSSPAAATSASAAPSGNASTAPATPASTAAATRQADQSTPKGALKTFVRALDAGDRETVLLLLYADNDNERGLAGATADLAAASATLRRAAIDKFGPDAARPLGAEPDAIARADERIDAARETLRDESATLRMADSEEPPLVLVRREGKWRMPVSELMKGVGAADVEKNLADMRREVALMREVSGEVAAGKYPSAVAARQALDQRIMGSTLAPPATRTAP